MAEPRRFKRHQRTVELVLGGLQLEGAERCDLDLADDPSSGQLI